MRYPVDPMTPSIRPREMAVSSLPSPLAVAGFRAEREPPRRHPMPRLHAGMACDTVFRMVAGRNLRDLTAYHQATCAGDPTALHHMRIALTRLRTAILFFSPVSADPER